MYIIKQQDRLIVRYVLDFDDTWTEEPHKAKKWASKLLADAYIKARGYKKCKIEIAPKLNENKIIE